MKISEIDLGHGFTERRGLTSKWVGEFLKRFSLLARRMRAFATFSKSPLPLVSQSPPATLSEALRAGPLLTVPSSQSLAIPSAPCLDKRNTFMARKASSKPESSNSTATMVFEAGFRMNGFSLAPPKPAPRDSANFSSEGTPMETGSGCNWLTKSSHS